MGTMSAAQLSDIRLAGGSGNRRLSLHARRIDDLNEPVGFIIQVLDVSERRAIEGRLQHSQRMEAIGHLAGGIAHDFNNLLTAMLGYCDLLLGRLPPQDPSVEDVAQIRANACRGSLLVRQLLAFARQQTLKPQTIDVDGALGELSKMLTRLLGASIQLKLEAGGCGCVSVDPGQFDQVIVNLAVNARDAMPDGGTLTIRTTRVDLPHAIHRGDDVVAPGAYLRIEVADTGVGIPKEIIGNIFEPFFSTKPPGAGTGLGLATVYGIVRQTNGHVFVDSAPGEGTTFSIYLPATAAPAARPAATAGGLPPGREPAAGPADRDDHPPPAPGRPPARILLVEDEDSIRLLAQRVLQRQGYEVVATDNGETAFATLAGDLAVDLLLSDVVMPGLDGRHLARLARERRPELRVMLMSGYAEHELGTDLEATTFLAKPFSVAELTDAVAGALTCEVPRPVTYGCRSDRPAPDGRHDWDG
jgi:two-component system cell cycle sensor histidine kinase/response regulator CckA